MYNEITLGKGGVRVEKRQEVISAVLDLQEDNLFNTDTDNKDATTNIINRLITTFEITKEELQKELDKR